MSKNRFYILPGKSPACRIFYFFFGIIIALFVSSGLHAQIITTIAGNGTMANTGDGGPATAAALYFPFGIVADTAGNVYFGVSSSQVRVVSPAGIITAFAGSSSVGYSGDGGPATTGRFAEPENIALDHFGNMYIADGGNYRIRKVNTAGIVTTYAGNGIRGNTGDGGPATAAEIRPNWIAVDTAGNVYFTDSVVIRKVSTAGIITTIAGNGTSVYSGDGVTATNTAINPHGITVDRASNLYIADYSNYRIRIVSPSGIINTYAGTGINGYSGDGGSATSAQLNIVYGLGTDSSDNLFICDVGNRRLRMVNAAGIITTISGIGMIGFSGDGGPATAAEMEGPYAVTKSKNGIIYLSDTHNNRIRMITDRLHFTHGYAQSMADCRDTIILDTLLAVSDTENIGRTESWSLLSPPAHGTAYVAYSAVSAGTVIVPSGLMYVPVPGYTGNDTFSVSITDSFASEVTTVHVSIPGAATAGIIIGPDTLCAGLPATLTNMAAGGVWSVSNTHAAISGGGVITGTVAGTDTISYTVANACDTAAVTKIITVQICPDEVHAPGISTTAFHISPNPNNGAFTVLLQSATTENAEIVVTDMVGRKVTEVTAVTNAPTPLQLNAPAGIYFISTATRHGKWNEKIIVQ